MRDGGPVYPDDVADSTSREHQSQDTRLIPTAVECAKKAEVLSRRVEPSGHPIFSFPRSTGAGPCYKHKFKSSGTPVACHFGSRYPFGHGLIYAEQLFSDLAIENKFVDIPKKSGC